jgi:probable rRNA maturation factor
MNRKPSKRLNLSVQYACNRDGLTLAGGFRALGACGTGGRRRDRHPPGRADEGQSLNKEYRGKDYATNVLSFPV